MANIYGMSEEEWEFYNEYNNTEKDAEQRPIFIYELVITNSQPDNGQL